MGRGVPWTATGNLGEPDEVSFPRRLSAQARRGLDLLALMLVAFGDSGIFARPYRLKGPRPTRFVVLNLGRHGPGPDTLGADRPPNGPRDLDGEIHELRPQVGEGDGRNELWNCPLIYQHAYQPSGTVPAERCRATLGKQARLMEPASLTMLLTPSEQTPIMPLCC